MSNLAKVQGTAHRGGKEILTSAITGYKLDETFPASTISVYNQGTTDLATIYSDSNATLKSNPFVLDSFAEYEFYAAQGHYDIKFSDGLISTPFTIGDILVLPDLQSLASTISSFVIAAANGVPTDGVTDTYAPLQALINSHSGVDRTNKRAILLPNCRINLSHPLRIPETCQVYGDPAGGTILVNNFGSGYTVNVRSIHDNITLGPKIWYTDTTNSMTVFSNAGKYINCSIDPNMLIRGLAQFSIDLVYKRTAPAPTGGVFVSSHAFLGNINLNYTEYEIIENINAGITVTWRGVTHSTANGILDLNAHHLALTYDGANVRLMLDGVIVLSFASTGAMTMQYIETVCIARQVRTFQETVHTTEGINGYIGVVRFSDIARWTANFTAPTLKPVVDTHTLLLINPDIRDEDYLVAQAGTRLFLGVSTPLAQPRNSYLLVGGTPEHQISHCVLRDIKVLNATGFVGNAFNIFDSIKGQYQNLFANQAYIGAIFNGVTFNSYANNIDIDSELYAFGVLNQSEGSSFSNIGAFGGGFACILVGSVGGVFSNFLVTPGSTNYGTFYCDSSTELNFHGLQLDDEGQAPELEGGIFIGSGVLRIYGGILSISAAKNLITCAGRGSIQLRGVTMVTGGLSPELIKFLDVPDQSARLDGCSLGLFSSTTILSSTPQYIIQDQDSRVKASVVDAITEYQLNDTTCFRRFLDDTTDPTGGANIDVEARAAIASINRNLRGSRLVKATNLALATNGGVASASSELTSGGRTYHVYYANDGELTGLGDLHHYWNSDPFGVLPQTFVIDFSANAIISEVVLYSLQDTYLSPHQPEEGEIFTLFGIVDYTIDYFNGSWHTAQTITGNNLLIARTILNSQFTGTKVRITINAVADAAFARIVELQAFGRLL